MWENKHLNNTIAELRSEPSVRTGNHTAQLVMDTFMQALKSPNLHDEMYAHQEYHTLKAMHTQYIQAVAEQVFKDTHANVDIHYTAITPEHEGLN